MTLDDYLLAADAFRAKDCVPRRPGATAIVLAWEAALPEIAKRAFRDGVGVDYFRQMISNLFDLIEAFHAATTKVNSSPDADRLWSHQKISLFDNLDPGTDVDIQKIKEIAARYTASPFIENGYFSWCLLDSIIFSEIRMFARVMASTQFGSAPANPAYFMSKGDPVRYSMLKPVFFVLGIIANYVTPIILGYYATEYGHEIIGGLFYAVAAVGLFSFLATYRKRQAVKARNEVLLEKAFEVYAALDGNKIPPDRMLVLLNEAKALGVRFDRIIPALAGVRQIEAAAGQG